MKDVSNTPLKNKKETEKSLVQEMIALYCRLKHKTKVGLCDDCFLLNNYALSRIDNCPRTLEKTFCSSCPTPCWNSKEKKKIKEVMKYSGKRMIFIHPLLCFKHIIDTIKKT